MNSKLFLGFVPRTLPDEYLLDYFSNFCSARTELFIERRKRSLFTNYKILNVSDASTKARILNNPHHLGNQLLLVWEFHGEATFQKFIATFSNRCVFLSGIPLTIDTDEIFDEINSEFRLLDLFILKNGLRINKHYGFATFESEEIKQMALMKKKFKSRKFKISCKNFELKFLEKLRNQGDQDKEWFGESYGGRRGRPSHSSKYKSTWVSSSQLSIENNWRPASNSYLPFSPPDHSSHQFRTSRHHQTDYAPNRGIRTRNRQNRPQINHNRPINSRIPYEMQPQLFRKGKGKRPYSRFLQKMGADVRANHHPRNVVLNLGHERQVPSYQAWLAERERIQSNQFINKQKYQQEELYQNQFMRRRHINKDGSELLPDNKKRFGDGEC
jgi:hypothetical protein